MLVYTKIKCTDGLSSFVIPSEECNDESRNDKSIHHYLREFVKTCLHELARGIIKVVCIPRLTAFAANDKIRAIVILSERSESKDDGWSSMNYFERGAQRGVEKSFTGSLGSVVATAPPSLEMLNALGRLHPSTPHFVSSLRMTSDVDSICHFRLVYRAAI